LFYDKLKGENMDYHASGNFIMNDNDIAWLCRKKSFVDKLREFFFGKETLDKHFGR